MICDRCGRKLKLNDLVIPILRVHPSTRYDPTPGTQADGYIHLDHFTLEERR